jgi:cupin superfamily acireductone dioxygenase involved in methionine salvage
MPWTAARRWSPPDYAATGIADMTDANAEKLLADPYGEWAADQGVPVVEDFGVDLKTVETKPWPRLGTDGAIVHLKGRGDFVAIFLIDLPPGGQGAPQRHLVEEVVYVISGHGSTTVETHDGRSHSFEWGPKSLFALPLNARYRHFNGSGRERARLASTNNAPLLINLFRNQDFLFDNPCRFPEREGPTDFFAGEGTFVPVRPGRHMWETNFIPDLSAFELQRWEARGAGSSNMKFILAEGTMHAHSSEMPVGTYKKGHRHGADFHVYAVTGHGYSLLWYDGDEDFVRVDWEHGVVFAPPDMMFHQHFNTAPHPSRYLAAALGSLRYPLTADKRNLFGAGVDADVRKGGRQIEYQDQDPRIHRIYLAELAKHGVSSAMGDHIDESRYETAAG